MPVALEYLLSLNTQAGSKRVQQLYNQANSLFANKGINLKINTGGSLPLGKFSSDLRKFESSLDAATARVAAFTSATTLLYGLGKALRRLATDTIGVEKAMYRINAVFQGTSSDVVKLQKDLFRTASLTGQSFQDAAVVMEEFARQGLSAADSIKATTAALTLARLSATSTDQVVQGLVATLATFNDESLDYVKVVDKLAAVDAKFATSAAGIVEGIKRAGAVAADAGLSFDQLSGYITAVKQISGRSEAVIGNGFKTILTNLQNAKVQEKLEQIGVATRNLAGDFLPLDSVLAQLTEKFRTLGDAQKASISQSVAGKFQINTFKSLIKAVDTGLYSEAVNTSKNAEDDKTAQRRNEFLNRTTAAGLTRLNNSYTEFNSNVGVQAVKPTVDKLAETLTNGLEAVSKGAGTTVGKALLKGLSDVLSGPALIYVFAIFGKLAKTVFVDLGKAIQALVGVGSKMRENFAVQTLITEAYANGNQQLVRQVSLATTVAERQAATNALLADYIALLNRANLAQSSLGTGVPRGPGSLGGQAVNALNTRGNFAGGYIPSLAAEGANIRAGIGGAHSNARPVIKSLDLGNGRQTVAVNSDEYLVKNYAGGRATAVFNREMVRSVGGVGNLSKFGNVEKVYADGYVPNFTPMSYKSFGKLGENLHRLYKKAGAGRFPRTQSKDFNLSEDPRIRDSYGYVLANAADKNIYINSNITKGSTARRVFSHELGHKLIQNAPIPSDIIQKLARASRIDFRKRFVYPENKNVRQNYPSKFPTATIEEHIASSFERLVTGRGDPRSTATRYLNKLLGALQRSKTGLLAGGSIPNLTPIQQSVNRELGALRGAGIGPSTAAQSIRLGSSSRLISNSNPGGLGVYNTAQGQYSLGKAISDHAGQKIPNFAPIYESVGTTDSITRLEKAIEENTIVSKAANKILKERGQSLTRAERNLPVNNPYIKSLSTAKLLQQVQSGTLPRNFIRSAVNEINDRIKSDQGRLRSLKAPTLPSALALRDDLLTKTLNPRTLSYVKGQDPTTGAGAYNILRVSQAIAGVEQKTEQNFATKIQNYKPSLLNRLLLGAEVKPESFIDKAAKSSRIDRNGAYFANFAAQNRERLAQARQSLLLKGSFALPFLTGALSGAAGGEETRTGRLTSGIGSAVSTGMVFASFGGKVAPTIGLVLAAVQALQAISKELGVDFKSLSKATEDAVAELKKSVEAASGALQAKGALEDATANNVSPKRRAQLAAEFRQALTQIPADALVGGKSLRSVISRGTNEEASSYLSRFSATQARRASANQFTLSVGGLADKFGTLRKLGLGIFGGDPLKSTLEDGDIEGLSSLIPSAIDYSKISSKNASIIELLSSYSYSPPVNRGYSGYSGNFAELGKSVGDYSVINNKISEDASIADKNFKKLLKSSGLGNAIPGVITLTKGFDDASRLKLYKTIAEAIKLNKALYALDEPLNKFNNNIADTGRALEIAATQTLSNNRIKLYKSSANFQTNAVKAENLLALNELGSSDYSVNQGRYALETEKIKQEANQQRLALFDSLSGSILQTVGGATGTDARSKIARSLALAANEGRGVNVGVLRSSIERDTGKSDTETTNKILQEVLSNSKNLEEELQKISVDEEKALEIAKDSFNTQSALLKQAERAAFYNTKALIGTNFSDIRGTLRGGDAAIESLRRDTRVNLDPTSRLSTNKKSIQERILERTDLAEKYLQGREIEKSLGLKNFTIPEGATDEQRNALLEIQKDIRKRDSEAIFEVKRGKFYQNERSILEENLGVIDRISKSQGNYDILPKRVKSKILESFDTEDYGGAINLLKGINPSEIFPTNVNQRNNLEVTLDKLIKNLTLLDKANISSGFQQAALEEANKGTPVEQLDASVKQAISQLTLANQNDNDLISASIIQNNLTIGVQDRLDALISLYEASTKFDVARSKYSEESGKLADLLTQENETPGKNAEDLKNFKLYSSELEKTQRIVDLAERGLSRSTKEEDLSYYKDVYDRNKSRVDFLKGRLKDLNGVVSIDDQRTRTAEAGKVLENAGLELNSSNRRGISSISFSAKDREEAEKLERERRERLQRISEKPQLTVPEPTNATSPPTAKAELNVTNDLNLQLAVAVNDATSKVSEVINSSEFQSAFKSLFSKMYEEATGTPPVLAPEIA